MIEVECDMLDLESEGVVIDQITAKEHALESRIMQANLSLANWHQMCPKFAEVYAGIDLFTRV